MLELLRKYRVPIVLIALLIGSLLFFSAGLRRKEAPDGLERRGLSLFAPLQKSAVMAISGVASIWTRFFGASAAETLRLQRENQALKGQLVTLEETQKELARMQKFLAYASQTDLQPVLARVIGTDATGWFRTVTVDRGSRDRLKEGMAAITEQGVVGRLGAVTPGAARILLLVDTASKISVLDERTRARGVIRGDGEKLVLDYVPLTDDVQVGDVLVTSGLSGTFPKGLVVGSVSAVDKRGYNMFQTISVDPAVDFARLEEVMIITGGNVQPTDSSTP